jgi:hypothetical protein
MWEHTREYLILSYGLDDPGIESRWEERFSVPVQTGPKDHPSPYTIDTGSLSLGVKRRGLAFTTTMSSAEVKERVELCLYSSSGPLWPVLG